MHVRAERIVAKHIDGDSTKNEKSGHHQKYQKTIATLLKNADKIDKFLSKNEKRIEHSRSKREV